MNDPSADTTARKEYHERSVSRVCIWGEVFPAFSRDSVRDI